MSNGWTTLQFKYNDVGLRTQKINGSTNTKYYWTGSVLGDLTDGTNTLHFWYDAAGMPTMVTHNNETTTTNYYYQHNLQGDIIGLMDMAGTTVVSYAYDSWGKQLSCTGSLANTLGAVNPLRYRGYIYDSETGLYYLQSSYYSPDICRFTSADNIIGKSGVLLSHNTYSYCMNSPISMTDSHGNCPNGSCFLYGKSPNYI
jgi:RHS repeat-associated protein